MILGNFRILLPRFRSTQDETIAWLTEAHYQAAIADGKKDVTRNELREKIQRYVCKPQDLAFRYHALEDFTHLDWDKMRIFNLSRSSGGANFAERMAFFEEVAVDAFQKLYEKELSPPEDLIHVTCTGYVSPSPAQKLVAGKGWTTTTTVTHAYHMGCHAAIPAVRMARNPKERIDIVHTELCTLHFNPRLRTPEQLVVQGLFADGLICYSAFSEEFFRKRSIPGLELLSIREELIRGTENEMSWKLGENGMNMTLSKDVALRIARALPLFLERLVGASELRRGIRQDLFAIHPGGPKIIEELRNQLDLRKEQTAHSEKILREHGNMSSATLPHIWQSMIEDPKVGEGQKIISLAFGPGLTVAGAIFKKRATG